MKTAQFATVLRESGGVMPDYIMPGAKTVGEYFLRKEIQSYEYKTVRFNNEYSRRMRKEITTNYTV